MKRPGLTEAMEYWLRMVARGRASNVSQKVINKLIEAGLIDRDENITPRGQAALAAPRVTAAEYEGLCEAEKGWTPTPARMRNRLHSLGWVVGLGIYASHLTPAGTTALNNIRAASGSPEWKP